VTETEWLSRSQLVAMLKHVYRSGCSDRKLQLAAIAFCRHMSHLPLPVEWHETVARFEEWVEGVATAEQVISVRQRLEAIADQPLSADEPRFSERFFGYKAAVLLVDTGPGRQRRSERLFMVESVAFDANQVFGAGHERTTRVAHCRIVRDIFGNPFRPVTPEPSWLTSTVLALANGIYEEKAFDRMPILADALQDAGCNNPDILDHCREPNGVHTRGCWVVDLVLGKK